MGLCATDSSCQHITPFNPWHSAWAQEEANIARETKGLRVYLYCMMQCCVKTNELALNKLSICISTVLQDKLVLKEHQTSGAKLLLVPELIQLPLHGTAITDYWLLLCAFRLCFTLAKSLMKAYTNEVQPICSSAQSGPCTL